MPTKPPRPKRLSAKQWKKKLLGDRAHPITAPACFSITPDGLPELALPPGFQFAIGPKEHERRFRLEPIKAFFARYREVGGDTRRLEALLMCLLPVALPQLPTQTDVNRSVRKAHRALQEVLRLPGALPGRELFEEAEYMLRILDTKKYLAQFTPEKPTLFRVEKVSPGLEAGYAYPPTFVPAIGKPGRGRIRRGSPTGLIIGVLAAECGRRFEVPWWPDIVAVCLALAPEVFDTKCDTVERLRKRVERVPRDEIALLHRKLFPAD